MHASSVIEAAEELFRARQYRAVVSQCTEALELDPDNLTLRILRARSLMALRRDEEAKRELSRVLRWHQDCGEAYRLLAELAIRRGKLDAASTFLKHALRLSPDDAAAQDLLELVQSSNQPTVAVEKLPAATATVGCTLSPEGLGALQDVTVTDGSSARDLHDLMEATATSASAPPAMPLEPAPPAVEHDVTVEAENPVETSWSRHARLAVGTDFEPPAPRTDRFGRYLVDIGALTPGQLRAALDYHRRAGVRVGSAAVALGFLSEPSVEWAAHDYHSARETTAVP